MSQLLDELRMLIEDELAEDGDEADADYPDAELKKYLNKYRSTLDDYSLTAETDDYLVWLCEYNYLDNVVLDSTTDTPIDSGNYTADDINGIYTFAVEPDPLAVYIKAQYYDLYKTASDIWLVRAARASFSGKVGLGDEEIPQDKYNREYCIQKHWELRPSDSNEMERG